VSYKLHSLSKEDENLVQEGKKLPVMEEFYTIQGEGFNTGKPAYFIRIGGCDVGCHWCDVKESWNANLHPLAHTDDVVQHVLDTGTNAVVITGGEPLIYNLEYLTASLKQHNILTFIETSGAYPLSGQWDWICLSPKKNAPPLEENFKHAHELKCIVYNQHDFKWAEELSEKVNNACHLFLQPEWSKSDKLLPEIIDYVKTHTRWRISLQTHKYMHIP
jgi:7-carboxy-7-deazaguanine synthase